MIPLSGCKISCQCSDYCQEHEMQLKSDFYKIYGNKFLDLQEVMKKWVIRSK